MFSNKLQRLRKKNHMSQEQLAIKLNVSRQAVSKWEMGTLPDINNLMKISQFFDCSLDYLLNDEDTDLKKNENIYEEKKADFKNWKEILSLLGIVSPLIVLIILSILASIFPSPITHQLSDGSWRYGLMGFIEHNGIEPLLYFLFFIFIIGITTYFILPALSNWQSKKFCYYSIGTYLFFLIGWIIFFYELFTSSILFYDFQSVTLCISYIVCAFILTVLLRNYRRKL